MNEGICCIAKEKQLRVNRKMMTLTFFELFLSWDYLHARLEAIIYKFSKDFTDHKRRLTGWLFSQTFLNTGTTNETFQQSGKEDPFKHILKRSVSIYESLGWQFFRTTTAIQSGSDTFDEWMFTMTFLTILGVREILCSSRLVLDRENR